MGSSVSVQLDVEEIYLYQELTGLNAAEISHAYKRFHTIDPLKFIEDKMGKIPYYEVADKLKELKFNPFRYRIAKVFTSSESGFMTFDDFLEMVTVMSDKAPLSSKLIWAFRIFDSNEDGRLCKEDLNVLLDVLSKKRLDQDLKDCLIDEVLNEADEDGDRVLTYSEFARVMTLHSGPEFIRSFSFRL